MYASSTFVFTAILALVRVTIATPPACLIAAMGAQANPADLAAICGSLETQVVGNITEKCSGDAEAAAISVYSATCLASESVTITVTTSSSSASGTGSATTTIGTGKTSATGSTTAKTTASNTGASASASATGKSSATENAPRFVLPIIAAGFAAQYLF